jgi:hypothetical protein
MWSWLPFNERFDGKFHDERCHQRHQA